MPERLNEAPAGYELVMVSRKLADRLIEDDSAPVVVVRLERNEDGTAQMVFRTPEPTDAMVERAAKAAVEWAHEAQVEEVDMALRCGDRSMVRALLTAALQQIQKGETA